MQKLLPLIMLLPLHTMAQEPIRFSETVTGNCYITINSPTGSIHFEGETFTNETYAGLSFNNNQGGRMRFELTKLEGSPELGTLYLALENMQDVGRWPEGAAITTADTSREYSFVADTDVFKNQLTDPSYTVTATFTLECGV